MLHDSLPNYLNWVVREITNISQLLKPGISIFVPCNKAMVSSFRELCDVAAEIFNDEINKIIEMATEFNESHQSLNYILLNCAEIII